jgi:hypothetical protein
MSNVTAPGPPTGSIQDRVGKLQATVKNHKNRLDGLQAYQDKDAKSIEREVNQQVVKMLQRMYEGYHVIDVLSLDKSLEHFYLPSVPEELTQFDGFYVVTNDDSYNLVTEPYTMTGRYRQKPAGSKIIWVIVEAKHDITTKRVNRKLNQIVKIQKALETARKLRDGVVDEDTRDIPLAFVNRSIYLEYYNMEPEIHLVLGGPYLEKSAEDHIKHIGKQLWNDPKPIKVSNTNIIPQIYPIRTSLFVPQGNRYSFGDVSDDFKPFKGFIIGGTAKKNRGCVPSVRSHPL